MTPVMSVYGLALSLLLKGFGILAALDGKSFPPLRLAKHSLTHHPATSVDILALAA